MIYHYYCRSCNMEFTQVKTGFEPDVKCPYCHSSKVISNWAKHKLEEGKK